jgi:hypothetical protein
MNVHRDIEARSRNHCYSGKAMSITYFECISVPLGIQHAIRKRRVMLSVACPILQSFSTLSHRWDDFRGGVIEFKMCVFIFSTTFLEKHFSFYEKLSRI